MRVNEPSHDVTISESPATLTLSASAPTTCVSSPLIRLIDGFHQALESTTIACDPGSATTAATATTAGGIWLALFKLGHLVDALAEQAPTLNGYPHVRGFRYVRHGMHHNAADPVYYDATTARGRGARATCSRSRTTRGTVTPRFGDRTTGCLPAAPSLTS